MSDREKDLKLLKDAANALGEHFDSVQIFATRHEPTIEDGTIAVASGVGNFYSRWSVAREWILKQDESARDSVREGDN